MRCTLGATPSLSVHAPEVQILIGARVDINVQDKRGLGLERCRAFARVVTRPHCDPNDMRYVSSCGSVSNRFRLASFKVGAVGHERSGVAPLSGTQECSASC